MRTIVVMLNFITEPTQNHLNVINRWLIDEQRKTGDGFYRHWSNLKGSFENGQLWVITLNGSAVGFVSFYIYSDSFAAVIEFAEIKPFNRKNSIGKSLITSALSKFKSLGVYVVQLTCSPIESEAFWMKVGFLNHPENLSSLPFDVYKVLVDSSLASETQTGKSSVSLWSCEPHLATRRKPEWIWNLNFQEDQSTLLKPIIFPVDCNWHIEILFNGRILVSDKVKRCPFNEGENAGFLIIRKLKTQ
jgi:N-acetylglutamate synthase-like GNAT family acetyltransferase